ncbi:MAG: chemotaxis protein CheB, partial [Opitutales bacterium]
MSQDEGKDAAQSGHKPLTVVGVGASGGGLRAFRQFLAAIPPESDLAIVLLQHLDPSHERLMADLLEEHASLPVREINEDMPVEAGVV